MGGFFSKRGFFNKQVSRPVDLSYLKELLPAQEPRNLVSMVSELWPALGESARQEFRLLAQSYGWEAYFITDLGKANLEKKMIAVEMLGLIGGEKSLWPLLGVLADREEALSFSAVAALKKLQAPDLLKALLDALTVPARWPPARVAEVILARGEEAVTPLLERFPVATGINRGYIVEILGELGDSKGIPCLIIALEDEEPVIRAKAAGALASLASPRSELVAPLLKALKDEAWEVRGRAALAIGVLGIKEGAAGLEDLLEDSDWRVKENVKQAMEQLTAVEKE